MNIFMVISDDQRADDVRLWKGNSKVKIVDDVNESELIVVAGGDGTLLHAIDDYINYERPFFGINRGTYGFYLNPIKSAIDLCIALEQGLYGQNIITLGLLTVEFFQANGNIVELNAFNDVYLNSPIGHSNHYSVEGRDYERKMAVGDGIIVATPQGSTAYTRNAGGPVLPLKRGLMAITSICSGLPPIRDIVDDQEITISVTKGVSIAHADATEVGNVVRAVIAPAQHRGEVRLCFTKEYNFKKIRYRPMEVPR